MDPASPKQKMKRGKPKSGMTVIEKEPVASSSNTSKGVERAKSKSPELGRVAADSAVSSSSGSTNTCDWETLPIEVCYRIMEPLYDDLESLISLGKVSAFWRTLMTSEETWESIFHRTFFHLEPSDEYFLEHGAPKPTLLKEVKTTQGTLPLGPSRYWHLFAHKFPLHRRWMKRQFTCHRIRANSEAERFSMMVQWKGFCVTAGGDGRISIWHPNNFSSTPSKEKKQLKPWRVLDTHQFHIWWMSIHGDLCFTVGSDGKFIVTNLEPLITDQNANVENVVVVSSMVPIWCIDVHRRSRKCVIGAQDGTVTLLSWKKGNWKQWKHMRTVKTRSGIWDVCILPGQRFAVCCTIDISIFNFEPSDVEKAVDAENPPQPEAGALVGVNRRAVGTPLDAKLPADGMVLENRSRQGLTRNLTMIDGLLIGACSTVGLEAWNPDTSERVWTLDTRGYDIFDIGITNNKLVCVGTDSDTGLAAVLVFDARTREFLLEAAPDSAIGRVFSTCVTDESIYVCAVDSLLHVNFAPPSASKPKEETSCSIS